MISMGFDFWVFFSRIDDNDTDVSALSKKMFVVQNLPLGGLGMIIRRSHRPTLASRSVYLWTPLILTRCGKPT